MIVIWYCRSCKRTDLRLCIILSFIKIMQKCRCCRRCVLSRIIYRFFCHYCTIQTLSFYSKWRIGYKRFSDYFKRPFFSLHSRAIKRIWNVLGDPKTIIFIFIWLHFLIFSPQTHKPRFISKLFKIIFQRIKQLQFLFPFPIIILSN